MQCGTNDFQVSSDKRILSQEHFHSVILAYPVNRINFACQQISNSISFHIYHHTLSYHALSEFTGHHTLTRLLPFLIIIIELSREKNSHHSFNKFSFTNIDAMPSIGIHKMGSKGISAFSRLSWISCFIIDYQPFRLGSLNPLSAFFPFVVIWAAPLLDTLANPSAASSAITVSYSLLTP